MALPRGAMGCMQFLIVVFPDHTNFLFLSLNIVGKFTNLIPLLTNWLSIQCKTKIGFRIKIRTKSTLSITPSKTCCIISLVSHIVEYLHSSYEVV